jgi:hypothetical protein
MPGTQGANAEGLNCTINPGDRSQSSPPPRPSECMPPTSIISRSDRTIPSLGAAAGHGASAHERDTDTPRCARRLERVRPGFAGRADFGAEKAARAASLHWKRRSVPPRCELYSTDRPVPVSGARRFRTVPVSAPAVLLALSLSLLSIPIQPLAKTNVGLRLRGGRAPGRSSALTLRSSGCILPQPVRHAAAVHTSSLRMVVQLGRGRPSPSPSRAASNNCRSRFCFCCCCCCRRRSDGRTGAVMQAEQRGCVYVCVSVHIRRPVACSGGRSRTAVRTRHRPSCAARYRRFS